MRELLTPRQVAQAIQVSESSVKRWCDRGVIPTRYTAGGHRRIPLSGLLGFLRASQHELRDATALGMPALATGADPAAPSCALRLAEALLAGDESRCRQIGVELFLAEHRMSVICDEVISAAFAYIGDRWACGEAEVYQERRGCELALRLLADLRTMLPAPELSAPLAIGGAPSGDHYALGTTMVELVLREGGWNAISLGSNLPFATLYAAFRDHRPQLFWLSCSHLDDEESFVRYYQELHDTFGLDVRFICGGRALGESARRSLPFAVYCENMCRLQEFVQTLRDAVPESPQVAEVCPEPVRISTYED